MSNENSTNNEQPQDKYLKMIDRFKERSQYFEKIDFPRLAGDFKDAATTIEELYKLLQKAEG